MPRPTKSTQKSTETAAAATPAAAPAVAAVAATPAPTKKTVRSSKKEEVTTPAPVVPEVAETVEDAAEAKTRVVPTRESVMTEFAELVNVLDAEIARLRDSADKNSGVKFLRGVARRVKSLQTSTARVVKQKQPSARKNNNSGFLKPVQISSEIAKFTGLPADQLHSRVEVTKHLCQYIKDKNLQNPADKRQIVADPALAKILNYDAKKDDKPLTYYRLQSLLKNNNHFPTVKA